MIAPEPAGPGPRPAVAPPPQAKELIGLDQTAATRLFGAAAERTEEPPATVWRYKTATCELDLFFYLDLRSGRTNHLLLSTVTGVAPFVSYVRTLYRDWKAGDSPMPGNHKLYCIQGGSRSWEFGYREEMERYAAEVPWLKYVATISRPWEDAAWTGETGRVDDLVRKYVSDWGLKPAETTGYLCGHPNMIENGRGILQRAGWQKGSTFEEVYFIPGKEVTTE